MLATDSALLADHYDIAIIGSGYGGAITASRLGFANHQSGRNLKIAVLERGEEHPTGTFPSREGEFFAQVHHPLLNPLGLYEYRSNPTIDVIQGCGLGGTSLINANVAIIPDREVFQFWPSQIQDDMNKGKPPYGKLQDYYDRALAMLGANPYASSQSLKKDDVFREVSGYVGGDFNYLNIVVSGQDRVTRYGVPRKKCTNSGDCVTGCNIGAKNTLATNYLPMARFYGVELFTCVEVSHLERVNGQEYRLICHQRTGPRGLVPRQRVVSAQHVILAAGSLGTTGILLRSGAAGLQLSGRTGKNFSGNGDFIAICYNSDHITDIQGFDLDTGPRSEVKPGPTITVVMRIGADEADLTKRFTVEDLSCPRALVDALRLGLFKIAPITNRDALVQPGHVSRWARDIVWNKDGATNSTLGYLIMAHDNSEGNIALAEGGSTTIDWPTAPTEPIYKEINDVLQQASARIGGTYITNPRWHYKLLGGHLITAHPLGGCATADDVGHGVVDDRGRVFKSDGTVHDGLYVADGSVIPRALGVNPFLTISMFAERAVEYLRQELNLPVYDPQKERDDA